MVTSTALEHNGLIKRKSCCAQPCSVPSSREPGTSGVSPLYNVCTRLLWLSHLFLQSSFLQRLSLPIMGGLFVTVVLVGIPWSGIRPDFCQRCSSTKLKGIFPLLFLGTFLLVSLSCSRTGCLPSDYCWAFIWLVCVVIFLSFLNRTHFGVMPASVEAACILTGL